MVWIPFYHPHLSSFSFSKQTYKQGDGGNEGSGLLQNASLADFCWTICEGVKADSYSQQKLQNHSVFACCGGSPSVTWGSFLPRSLTPLLAATSEPTPAAPCHCSGTVPTSLGPLLDVFFEWSLPIQAQIGWQAAAEAKTAWTCPERLPLTSCGNLSLQKGKRKALYILLLPQDCLVLAPRLGHTEPVTPQAIVFLEEQMKKSIISGFFFQLVVLHSASLPLGWFVLWGGRCCEDGWGQAVSARYNYLASQHSPNVLGDSKKTLWSSVPPFGLSVLFLHKAEYSDLAPDSSSHWQTTVVNVALICDCGCTQKSWLTCPDGDSSRAHNVNSCESLLYQILQGANLCDSCVPFLLLPLISS